MDNIQYTLQGDSLVFLIISLLITGILAGSMKYLFEHFLPVRSQRKQNALDNFERYKNKLLKTSASLISSLNLYMRYLDENSLPLEEDEYASMTLLYAFSSFFGWNQIMEENVLDELDLTVYHKQRKYRDLFYRSHKSLSSPSYFRPLRKADRKYEEIVACSAIKARDLRKIGCAMVIEEGTTDHRSFSVINILDFERKYQHDTEFRKVFDFLKHIKRDPENMHWCRATILLVNLQSFMNLLDKQHLRTNDNRFDQLHDCHPLFGEHIRSICSVEEKKIIREMNISEKI